MSQRGARNAERGAKGHVNGGARPWLLAVCSALRVRRPALPLLFVLASAPALAQSVSVTPSLGATDGYAREGTYLMVRLGVKNGTDSQITSVHMTSGGPVDVRSLLDLAPRAGGGSSVRNNEDTPEYEPSAIGEVDLPVFYVGGTPTLSLEFLSGAAVVARVATAPLPVRKLGDDEALVGVERGVPELDDKRRADLARVLGVKTLHVVPYSKQMAIFSQQFGSLDACLVRPSTTAADGREATVREEGTGTYVLARHRFPIGTEVLVQPETFHLLAQAPWPADQRLNLWLWLGLFCLAVPAVGLCLPRRRAVLATCVLLATAGVAATLLNYVGRVRHEWKTEAVVAYPSAADEAVPIEDLVFLGGRGGAEPCLEFDAWQHGLPLPILGSSSDVFRPLGTLEISWGQFSRFVSHRDQAVVHFLWSRVRQGEDEFAGPVRPVAPGLAARLAEARGTVAVLSVNGDRATDARGETRPLGGWQAEWQASSDAQMAFVGRSLAWWASQRQEGADDYVLHWVRNPSSPWAVAAPIAKEWPALMAYRLPAAGK